MTTSKKIQKRIEEQYEEKQNNEKEVPMFLWSETLLSLKCVRLK